MLGFTSMVTYSIQSVSPCATLSSQLHALFHILVKIQCIVGVSLSNTEIIDFTTTLPYSASDTDVVQNQDFIRVCQNVLQSTSEWLMFITCS